MASKTPQLGGYDLEFVDETPDALVCPICTFVAKDPEQMNCCGRVYCQLCLSEHKKISFICPHCRQNGDSFVDKRSDKEIKALKIKCTNETDGCTWVNELSCLEEHLKSCDYTLVSCDNECKEKDIITMLLRRDISEHLANECPRRQIECTYCHETGEYQERMGTHLDTCPYVSTACPNEECHKRFPRVNAAQHAEVCDYQPVTCKYAEVGCEETVLRKDLQEHEEDAQLHLRITSESVLKLKQDIKRVELMVKKEEYTFKVHPFQQLKNEDKTIYSPQYYVKGYKLYLSIQVNGNSSTEKAHVSVYSYLKKGKFDEYLTWPFTGTVIVEVLNQLEDKNHYRETITYIPDQDNERCPSHRVMSGMSTRGWGIPKFISHTNLEYKREENCQYLKDDTLVFRVSVSLPNHKPWLDCTVLPADYLGCPSSPAAPRKEIKKKKFI